MKRNTVVTLTALMTPDVPVDVFKKFPTFHEDSKSLLYFRLVCTVWNDVLKDHVTKIRQILNNFTSFKRLNFTFGVKEDIVNRYISKIFRVQYWRYKKIRHRAQGTFFSGFLQCDGKLMNQKIITYSKVNDDEQKPGSKQEELCNQIIKVRHKGTGNFISLMSNSEYYFSGWILIREYNVAYVCVRTRFGYDSYLQREIDKQQNMYLDHVPFILAEEKFVLDKWWLIYTYDDILSAVKEVKNAQIEWKQQNWYDPEDYVIAFHYALPEEMIDSE